MRDRRGARSALDRRVDELRHVARATPHRGWIRAIREALGMSTSELAVRMGIGQSRVSAIERGEVHGTLKLDTLERAARALDCDLFYALIPRAPLTESVQQQAKRKAEILLASVKHHMLLEDQVAPDDEDQLNDLASGLIDRRGLWAQP